MRYALSLLTACLITAAQATEVGQRAPDFGPGRWFNSAPLHLQDLRGKVLIVNIWVYSCINCHLSLPTLKGWDAKYRREGLEIVGVHTPELQSDRPAENVAAALKRDAVLWPVLQDNDSVTWNAYANRAWPTFYLIDRRGVVRAVYEGEISSRYPGAIPGLERTLRALLAER